MLLGVMLFFDGALLALGNVCLIPLSSYIHATHSQFQFRNPGYAVVIPLRPHADHRSSKDFLLLRTKTKAQRDRLFHWWNLVGLSQMAVRRHGCGDYWILEPLWVRFCASRSSYT